MSRHGAYARKHLAGFGRARSKTPVVPAHAGAGKEELTTGRRLSEAIDLHQAARLGEAEAIYREILDRQPDCADALHLLGMVEYQRGELANAAGLIKRAIALKSGDSSFHANLGNVLLHRNDASGALEYYSRAIALKPVNSSAWSGRGLALQTLERLDEAGTSFERALQLSPKSPELHCNLGNLRLREGRIEEAIELHRRAITLRPDYADGWSNLGAALSMGGNAGAHQTGNQKGDRTGNQTGDQPENQAAKPSMNVVEGQAMLTEAVGSFRRALELKPDFAEGYSNLGETLQLLSDVQEARACYDRALALHPMSASAHSNRALLRLLMGDLAGGFREYEWRSTLQPVRDFLSRRWSGEPLSDDLGRVRGQEAGSLAKPLGEMAADPRLNPEAIPEPPPKAIPDRSRKILLYAEQGMGDTIQFVRYVPLVQAHGGRVVLEVQAPLRRLVREATADCEVVAAGESLPAFGWQIPMMSLPLAFGTELGSIGATLPADGRYLRAPLVAKQRARSHFALELKRKGLRVGLVWAGNPAHRRDRYRSIRLAQLQPILNLRGASFFSLQMGPAARELEEIHPGSGNSSQAGQAQMSAPAGITDLTGIIEDFADTAALIEELDLVIAVDTAVAHLAGALGKPVWVLLPKAPDWRWFLGRTDSPWYPTMRLFRQSVFQDWTGVIGSVREALEQLIQREMESDSE